MGRQASGMVPRAQLVQWCMRAKPSTAAPVTLTATPNSGCSLAGLRPGQWARLLPELHQ